MSLAKKKEEVLTNYALYQEQQKKKKAAQTCSIRIVVLLTPGKKNFENILWFYLSTVFTHT